MFREDGLTTTLFRRYTRVVAMRYLWDTLAVVLNELKVMPIIIIQSILIIHLEYFEREERNERGFADELRQ